MTRHDKPDVSPGHDTLPVSQSGAASTVSASHSASGDQANRAMPARLGRFIILDSLGSGGMGSVFAAWDRELERRVAIKILHSEDRERFLREAQALARLSHPNVVTVYDVESAEGQDFIAMELVEGVSLRRWLLDKRRPWREVLAHFLDAGRGLAAVHDVGIVHRDFKPDNVLVSNNGAIRIADFGLARGVATPGPSTDPRAQPSELLAATVTGAGVIVGTPRYMPPEQLVGADPEPRADQYSFSVSLWEALFGHHPEEKEETFPPALGRVPRAVRQVIARGCAADAAARYPSLKSLLAELRSQAARRSWVLAVALGAAAVAVAAVLLVTRPASPAEVCARAGDFTAAWRPEDRATLRVAFLATGAPGAEASADGALGALDGYSASIGVSHGARGRPRRARVEHVESEAVLGLRATCLHRRFAEMRALTGELGRPDAELVHKAMTAVASLPPVSSCADVEALAAPTSVPADPTQRAGVARLRDELDAVDAVTLAGRYDEALPRAAAAIETARQIGFQPLVADSLAAEAQVQLRKEDLTTAEQTYEELVLTAQAAGYDSLLATAMTKLVHIVGFDGKRMADARRWSQLAGPVDDLIASRPNVPSGAAEVAKRRGALALAMVDLERGAGRLAETEAQARRAVALYASADPEHLYEVIPELVMSLHAGGHPVEAEQLAAVLFALDVDRHAPGDDLAADWLLIASIEIDLGRRQDALVDFQKSVDLARAALGPDAITVAHSLEGVAIVNQKLEHYDEALEDFRQMRAIYLQHFAPDSPKIARTYTDEGTILSALQRWDEARAPRSSTRWRSIRRPSRRASTSRSSSPSSPGSTACKTARTPPSPTPSMPWRSPRRPTPDGYEMFDILNMLGHGLLPSSRPRRCRSCGARSRAARSSTATRPSWPMPSTGWGNACSISISSPRRARCWNGRSRWRRRRCRRAAS